MFPVIMKAVYNGYYGPAAVEVKDTGVRFWDWFVLGKFQGERYSEVAEHYPTIHLYLTSECLWWMFSVLSVGKYHCPHCGRG